MTPEDINDLANRIKDLNEYVQKTVKDSQYWSEQKILKTKEKLEKYISSEMSEVSKAVQEQIDPVIESITQLKSKYEDLLPENVSGNLGHVISYLENVATELFLGPYNEILELLSSYAVPIKRLNAEMQKMSTITLASVNSAKNNIIKVNPPNIPMPEINNG